MRNRRKAYAPNPSYIKLTEATLNRLVKGHDKDGYVILSASRGDKTDAENNRRFEELKKKVWNLGYSYIPVFGGYKITHSAEKLTIPTGGFCKLHDGTLEIGFCKSETNVPLVLAKFEYF